MTNEPYNIDLIIESIQTSFLSLAAGLGLCNYYHRNASFIEEDLRDIEVDKYRLSQEIQLIALRRKASERFIISASLRAVFSAMYEGIKNNYDFSEKIKFILGECNYHSFNPLIRFMRNLYSHEFTWMNSGDIILKAKDYSKMISYRKKRNLPLVLSIDVKYKDLANIKMPILENYRCQFSLDMNELKEGIRLTDVMPLYNQFMLAELCHNICNKIDMS